ncbi:GntR family transcriptional regulator [Sneathiella aquimaris]|uniref:GntR family transcriptional regulator n=1 Tax=Sneathiella aquimaris TaxID=2599305 RepID=UPI00146F58CF|nr:GntR family transcriptional regulator [Sneathiella aquimaris]
MSDMLRAVDTTRQKPAKKNQQDEHIYDQMLSAILEQRLSPGTKLSEDVLGEIFGVSRTVVRKVLQRLAYEKVVRILPNRGAYVSEPSPDEARDVLEARKIVEAGIIRKVVKNRTEADIKRLEKMLADEAGSIEQGKYSKWVALSGDFHLALAEIAKNTPLQDYLRELVSRTSLILVQYQTGRVGNQSCSCDEHGDIIAAIRDQDEEKAVKLMHDHLQACEEQLKLDGADPVSDLYKIFSSAAD